MFGRKLIFRDLVLLAVLLAVSENCDGRTVEEEQELLDKVYVRGDVQLPSENCDSLLGQIESCVDCYPSGHELVKDRTDLEELNVRVDNNTCTANAYVTLRCIPRDEVQQISGMCGLRNTKGVGSRIPVKSDDGIQNTAFGEFPWVVAILRSCDKQEYQLHCTGSLINSRTVLTTARCVELRYCSYRVRAGIWKLSSNDTEFPSQEVDCNQVIVHEEYNLKTFENNIALLILESQIEAKKHIGFPCLDSDSYLKEDSECYVAGWGIGGMQRDILGYIKMTHLDRGNCEQSLRESKLDNKFKLDRSYICAREEKEKTARIGEDGSALVCALKGQKNHFVQYGISSTDLTFDLGNMPNVFTCVTIFKTWIEVKIDEAFPNDDTLVKNPYEIKMLKIN